MSQKLRRDQILQILNAKGYVTVRYLVDALHYSSATINRDLNAMQTLKLVKRSYGGVEVYNQTSLPPLPMREFYHKSEKRAIAKEAANLIEDGDVIFLSGTTTVQYMIPFLANKKNLTVITNGLRIALELGEFDMEVICLGGRIKERPHVLSDELTMENAMKFRVDKMFFSTNKITEDGMISTTGYFLTSIVMKNSKKIYLLTDKTKIVDNMYRSLCDFSSLDGIISDFDFSEKTQKAYPKVKFISAKN